MTFESIKEVFEAQIRRKGTNPFRCAKEAGLPGTAIRHVLEGHEPRISRLAEICDALGLELYVGRPRQPVSVPPIQSPRVKNDVSGSRPVEDRDLAEVLAVFVDAWESGTERNRGDLLGRFKMAFREERESAASAPGPRVAELSKAPPPLRGK